MANPVYVTLSSTVVSRVVNLDWRDNPFNASLAVTGSSSGTFSYAVEFTLDDQQTLTNIGSTRSPVWLPDANLAAASSNGVTNYILPVAAVRFTATALSSAAITMCVMQAGPP